MKLTEILKERYNNLHNKNEYKKDRKEKGGGLKIEELNNCIIDETLDKVEKMLINQLEILKIMEEEDLPLQKEKIIKRLNSVINKLESIDYDNR